MGGAPINPLIRCLRVGACGEEAGAHAFFSRTAWRADKSCNCWVRAGINLQAAVICSASWAFVCLFPLRLVWASPAPGGVHRPLLLQSKKPTCLLSHLLAMCERRHWTPLVPDNQEALPRPCCSRAVLWGLLCPTWCLKPMAPTPLFPL